MDTKLIEWSKTILLTQAIMPRLLNAITKENEEMMDLGYGSRHYDMGQNTYDFLDNMLKVNIRLRNLRELSLDVQSVLDGMASEDRTILVERFLKKKSVGELMPHLNIRTAYRRYREALSSFALGMKRIGYDTNAYEHLFGSDKVISLIHKRVVSHAIVFRSENEKLKDIISDKVTRLDTSKVPCSNMSKLGSDESVVMMA